MPKVRPLSESGQRWQRGMIESRPKTCWKCGKKTRAWWKKGYCQYCGAELPFDRYYKLQ